ncbi:DUF1508 domain-containing protein [Croceibacterium ferulae]|uniref:DUF1508 domain-containing protein n=1 Tax=Croceibacterium ferulae TaxID=1854641 RepID=UPI0013904EA2|nr:DUF1508 domain-containing protein [Croceibacterium ferulae]
MGFDTNVTRASSSADRHFLAQSGLGYASNDLLPIEIAEARQNHFAIFRVESVSLTSTQFSGGDWRWRLSDPDGTVLVEAGGYRSEAHCREAVAILQARAARATVA